MGSKRYWELFGKAKRISKGKETGDFTVDGYGIGRTTKRTRSLVWLKENYITTHKPEIMNSDVAADEL
jgi:hypothetical protein